MTKPFMSRKILSPPSRRLYCCRISRCECELDDLPLVAQAEHALDGRVAQNNILCLQYRYQCRYCRRGRSCCACDTDGAADGCEWCRATALRAAGRIFVHGNPSCGTIPFIWRRSCLPRLVWLLRSDVACSWTSEILSTGRLFPCFRALSVPLLSSLTSRSCPAACTLQRMRMQTCFFSRCRRADLRPWSCCLRHRPALPAPYPSSAPCVPFLKHSRLMLHILNTLRQTPLALAATCPRDYDLEITATKALDGERRRRGREGLKTGEVGCRTSGPWR